jgi:hypothetical protein
VGPRRVTYDALMRIGSGASAEDRPAGRAGQEAVTRVLREVAGLGPYFAVSTDPAEEDDPGWRPLAGLDPGSLRDLISGYAGRLGTGEDRVAASILFQGLAARLWSPVVAAAACGIVPDLSALRWRWAAGSPIALWLPDPGGWAAGDRSAELAHRTVVDGHLRPLVRAVGGVGRVAEGLLWGNAGSALAGVLQVRTPPGLRDPMSEVVRGVLKRAPLAGTGSLGPQGSFARHSCCLYYRVPPGGGLCGDCVLRDRRRS